MASSTAGGPPARLQHRMSVVMGPDVLNPLQLRVLVVDDDRTSQRTVAQCLKKAGYKEVLTAENGEEALRLCEEAVEPIDIIISDVYMPKLDGFGLCTKIRAMPRYNTSAVIMISGGQDLDFVVKCLRSGADDFIVKPAMFETIRNVWRSAWRRRNFEQKLHSEQRSLRNQVAELETQMHQAVETPINAILRTISDLARMDSLGQDARDALTAVVKSLSSSNLYRAVIQEKAGSTTDDTTRKWLSTMLDLEEPAAAPEKAPARGVVFAPADVDVERLRQWNFDQWEYKEEQLLMLIHRMFSDFGLLEGFSISDTKLRSFIVAVRNLYRPSNPYHNFRHAFDVTHAVYVFLTAGKAAELLTPLDILALLVGALCHDIEHPGVNNTFQVYTSSKLALRYNDRSVLENHHASKTFRLLQQPEHNFLENLKPAEMREFRQSLVQAVLATDLATHMEFAGKMSAMLETGFRYQREDRLLLVTLLLKAGDVSNPCKPFPLAKLWSDMVLEEFFQQGDQEKRLGLPISPYMDRSCKAQGRMSINFIDFIVQPYFSKLAQLLPDLSFIMDILKQNRAQWVEVEREEQALMAAAAAAVATGGAKPASA